MNNKLIRSQSRATPKVTTNVVVKVIIFWWRDNIAPYIPRFDFRPFAMFVMIVGASIAWIKAPQESEEKYGAFFAVADEQDDQNTEVLDFGDEAQPEENIGPTKKVKAVRKNDTAPVLTAAPKSAEEYIQRYWKVAVQEMHYSGIPASITLAQGLVESNAGQSRLALQANNHFGIKCFSTKCKKGHCMNATDDTHKDFFRKFYSPWESYREHSNFLKNKPRYRELFTYGKDYRKWAKGLKKAGYATDRSYASTLISKIQAYKLDRYDKM